MGGPGDDTINSRDGARDTVDCWPGWDAVVADENDVVPASCEHANFNAAVVEDDSGSMLALGTTNVNNRPGSVDVVLEHPMKDLGSCAALACTYTNLPVTATAPIAPSWAASARSQTSARTARARCG